MMRRRLHTKLGVHAKTPYGWLRGEIPHSPVPDAVVLVLTRELGRPVDFERLWPDTTRSNMCWPAEHRADLPWSQSGLTQYLEEWTDAMLTRRKFTAISGAALTVPVWNLLDHPAPSLASVVHDEAEYVTDPMMLLVEDTVARAQQLDDQQGGGAALNYVGDQFNAVARLIRRASYGRPVGRRLCTALAQLAQTAGFMAYDGAGDDGQAQRWYMAGLRAAHTAGDRPLVASILSLLSNQAATRGHINDGLQLASAAELAATNAPATVQALITARSCLAHAAAGDLSGLRRAREHSQTHLNNARHHDEPTPRWMGYATSTELDAIAGRSLVILATRISRQKRLALLADAQTLLHDRAFNSTATHRRSAVRHGAWLATAHMQSRDLLEAVAAGRRALQHAPEVTSARSIGLLQQLRDDLTGHTHRHLDVRTFVRQLNQQLPNNTTHVAPA